VTLQRDAAATPQAAPPGSKKCTVSFMPDIGPPWSRGVDPVAPRHGLRGRQAAAGPSATAGPRARRHAVVLTELIYYLDY
jgi:hypothetical protein